MTINIDIPPDIQYNLEARWKDMPRMILEAIALEGYRQEALSRGQVGRLLSLNFWETEQFLKERGAWLHYDQKDLDEDIYFLDRLLDK